VHVIGLLIPASWTAAVICEHAYQLQAVVLDGLAGLATLTESR
jgi:nitrate reductase gamma subunit